jgi:drug/metabolite transporter (DMT)-like permease
VGYGASDFVAGFGTRRSTAVAVSLAGSTFALGAMLVAVPFFGGSGPSLRPMAWGAAAGLGGVIGTVALYQGLAHGRMSVVAPLSGVISAVAAVLAGLAFGDRLSLAQAAGVIVAIPAILLVSSVRQEVGGPRSGVTEGLVAGAGFAVVFVALGRAGDASGAWPVVALQAVSVALLGLAVLVRGNAHLGLREAVAPGAFAGLLGGTSLLLYLVATSHGQLSIVAVLSSLYPAVTILLARVVLHERWSRLQIAGLVAAGAAIALISGG